MPKQGVSQLSGYNLVSQSVVVAQKQAEQDQAISHCRGAPGRREVTGEEIDRVNAMEIGSAQGEALQLGRNGLQGALTSGHSSQSQEGR